MLELFNKSSKADSCPPQADSCLNNDDYDNIEANDNIDDNDDDNNNDNDNDDDDDAFDQETVNSDDDECRSEEYVDE